MAKILIYNNKTIEWKHITKGEEEAMPYNNGTLKIKRIQRIKQKVIYYGQIEEQCKSWNNFRTLYGRPIYVGFAFKKMLGRWPWITKVNIMQEWLLMSHKT